MTLLPTAHRVDVDAIPAIDVAGPTIQFLTPLDGDDGAPCMLRGTIPPGGVVPLHSHADPETFLMMSGSLEGLRITVTGFEWLPVRPGDVFHVPGDAQHAWRNLGQQPAVTVVTTTVKLARFFRAVGDAPPARLLEVSERYGYWNATPEENAAVGLRLG